MGRLTVREDLYSKMSEKNVFTTHTCLGHKYCGFALHTKILLYVYLK